MSLASGQLLPRRFWSLAATLLLFALLHSVWATSLDGFTVDEPYHIAAGASYVRLHDYRLNPEHPPLVKLFAGVFETPAVLHLPPLPKIDGKYEERLYTQGAVFTSSNDTWVQKRSRAAMWTLNLALLLMLTLLVRRLFGDGIALATLLLLALDPTVSAHMPVVMTDLPMALLGLSACCVTALLLRDGRSIDWVLLGLLSGLLLATKHSAPLILLPMLAALVAGLSSRVLRDGWRGTHFYGLCLSIGLSVTVLWATYGFRYHETPASPSGVYQETFNRPLEKKISDLHSPILKKTLSFATRAHLAPRSYLWGLADTLRAGVEGRPTWVTAFGRSYEGKAAPKWIPLVFLLVKLPVGFIALFGIGVWLALRERREHVSLCIVSAVGLCFFAYVTANGVYYAGIRHWLFVVPVMALFAALTLAKATERNDRAMRWATVSCLLLIALSVLPQRRIWNYHNELVGGTNNAWRYFDNESVDLGQRSREMLDFYAGNVSPERVLRVYPIFKELGNARGFKVMHPAPEEIADGHIRGWIFASGNALASRNWDSIETMRNVRPTKQFGPAVLYHGDFYLPEVTGEIIGSEGIRHFYEPGGDRGKAEPLMLQSASMVKRCIAQCVLLGNFALGRNEIEKAVAWYARVAKDTDDATVRADALDQVGKVRAGAKQPMRNPFDE